MGLRYSKSLLTKEMTRHRTGQDRKWNFINMSPDLPENKKSSSRGLKTVRPGNQRCKAIPQDYARNSTQLRSLALVV